MPRTYDPLALYRIGKPAPADGWLVSEWATAQSSIMGWSPGHVRTAADGATELVLDNAPPGSPRPFLGGEIQSNATATTGTWSWTAEAPDMVDGAVFGLFTYQADHARDPWLEFDFEFVGGDTTEVHLAVHMEDVQGRHISTGAVVDLGFDAAAGLHEYDLTLTGTGAVFRADGRVLAYFSGADMPGGVWNTGRSKSYVDLWAADKSYDAWTGGWRDPGRPLVARVAEAEVRPGDLGGAMPRLGTAGADKLSGDARADVIDGLGGADTVAGGAGHDRLMGGHGDDVLYLDAGDDWVNGGSGTDWLRAWNTTSAKVDLGNTWGSQATGDGTDTLRNIENVSGGSSGDDIRGSVGANHLKGWNGDDWIDGRAGADRINGGLGRDGMAGGADRDRDVFVFGSVADSQPGAGDVVQQFVLGIDDLDLGLIDANARLAGDQAFAWGGTTAKANAAWFASWGSSVVLRADASGDGVADLEVQVLGVTRLGSGDLLL